MYNVALEWILGFRVRGASFVLDPCIPRAWPKFEISFRHRSARYDITVENPLGVCRSYGEARWRDADWHPKKLIPLADDGVQHSVEVVPG